MTGHDQSAGQFSPPTGNRWSVHLVRLLAVILIAIPLAVVATEPPDRGEQVGWADGAPMPEPRGEGSAAVGMREQGCDDPPCQIVAVTGGFEPLFSTSSRVEAWLPDEDRWIRLPDLPEARHHLAAAGLPDGSLVVTGGAGSLISWDPTDDVWILRPDSDEWASLDPLPEPRWGHRAVAVDDQVVVVGGHGGDTTFIWEEGEGWRTGEPIPRARDHLGAVVVDGEIWVIGGRDHRIRDRVDIYDPSNDTWREGPSLPEPTSAAAVGLVDRTLIVASGEDDSVLSGGMVRESWLLDVDGEKPEWRPMVRPPQDMHGAGDAVIGEGEDARLLILGGATRHGAFSPLDWSDRLMILEAPFERAVDH